MLKLNHIISGCVAAVLLINIAPTVIFPTQTAVYADEPFWITIFKSLTRLPVPRRPGGGKGDFQLISPGVWGREQTVWHTEPMIIWQGSSDRSTQPDRAELLDRGRVIWSRAIAGESFVAVPIGVSLKPGNRYQLRLLKNNQVFTVPIAFRVLSEQERDRIMDQVVAAELETRIVRDKPTGLLEADVDVFIQNQLWSDALQAINESENLSECDRQKLTQAVVRQWNLDARKKGE